MSNVTTTIRKSGRLANKTAIPYKEKKIPKLSKIRISKKSVVQKDQKALSALRIQSKKGNIEKSKVERIRVEKTKVEKTKVIEFSNAPSALYILSEETHIDNAIEHFKKHDPKLASYINDEVLASFKERMSRDRKSDPFRSLASGIIYQQIHGKAAASIEARFIQLFGSQEGKDWYPSPADVLKKSTDELRSAGLSARKAEYIQCLAQKFNDKTITPENFVNMSGTEIGEQLTQVKGIGQWTVDMFLMLNLKHSDVLPLGDLGVRRGVAQHFNLAMPSDKKKSFPLPHHMVEMTDIWRPYRTVGSWLMWKILDIKVTGDQSNNT
ncbi:DNA glycosylase [Parasitella parasitica]|nr:DNA glycosylase [Parasitella parasitica]